MRLGIFAKTFPGTDPAVVLAATRAAGFEAVQYNMACSGLAPMPDDIPAAVVTAIAAAARGNDVTIGAVSGTYNMIHPDTAVRDTGMRRLERLAASARDMGTDLITLCTGTRDPEDQWRGHPDNATPEAWRDLLTEMSRAAEIAERHGVRLGIEPELANVVDSAAKARALIDAVASPAVVIVLDPANLFEMEPLPRQRDIVAAAIDLLADRIALAHAKDRAPDGAFVTAGTGVLDYGHYLFRLRSVNFQGGLITHGLTAEEAPGVARFLRARLDSL